MKRLLVFFGGIVGILSLLFIGTTVLSKESGATSSSDPNTLIIYNWGEYVDPDLIKKFETESGYSVIYNTFDSNEAMETKVK